MPLDDFRRLDLRAKEGIYELSGRRWSPTLCGSLGDLLSCSGKVALLLRLVFHGVACTLLRDRDKRHQGQALGRGREERFDGQSRRGARRPAKIAPTELSEITALFGIEQPSIEALRQISAVG